ncbi:MAG: T9SS type A sorting domain-containing protein [Bacteroidia bacterium]|nr:T9SS type A sorting domain-containing protein [Bacteroidia bacterium]
MKQIISILILFLLNSSVHAQVASWNWSAAPANYNETGLLTNITATALSVSSGTISYIASPGAVSVASWSTSPTFSVSGKYWQVSISPSANFQTTISSFSFDAGRTSSGPQTITVQYSLDGFTSAGINLLSSAANTSTSALLNFTTNTNLPIAATTNTITFRIWGYGASSTGNFRINNISISGNTSSTNLITNYFLKSSGPCNLTGSWTDDSTLSSGNNPGNFSAINQIFNLRNQTNATLTGTWDVTGAGSKIILGDSIHAINLIIPAAFALSSVNGIDVAANSTLYLNNSGIPLFGNISSLSTIIYGAVTGTQSITQTNYGNLTLSGGGVRIFPNGIIRVSGTFDPGSFTSANNGTLQFNGSDGQIIPAFSYYHLNSTNNTRLLANGIIGIQGIFLPGSNYYTLGTSTLNFCGTSAQTIPALLTIEGVNYYNLTYTGTNRATLSDSITVSNNVTVTSGVLAITLSTKKILTIGGDLLINGGTIDFASTGATGAGEINLKGNLIQTTLFGTTTTANVGNGMLNFKGYKSNLTPQTISLFTTNSLNYTNLQIHYGTAVRLLSNLLLRRETTINLSYQGTLTVNGTLDLGIFTFNGGINNNTTNTFANFILNSKATLITSNSAGIQTGIGSNYLNRTFNDSASYIFNGASVSPFPTATQQPIFGVPYNITINASVTANRILNIAGTLNIAANIILTLDSFPLSFMFITGAGTLAVYTYSAIMVKGVPAISTGIGDNTLYFDSIHQTIGSLTIGSNNNPATATIGSTLNIKPGGVLNFGSAGLSNLFTSGNLTLKSNNTASASIANTFGSNITGNINTERYINANTRRNRFLAFPFISGVTLTDYRDDMWITGPGTGTGSPGATNYNSNGFHYTLANDTSVFTYNESKNNTASGTRWEGITNCSESLTSGTGYRLFYRGPVSQGITCIDGTKPLPESVCLGASGFIKTGTQIFTVNCSNGCINVAGTSATNLDDGWNLVANPYPSAIDWNALTGWTKSNIKQVIWIWNPINGSYGNWDGLTQTNGVHGIIASGQAFFVRANGASPSLSCTEYVKVNSNPSNLFKDGKKYFLSVKLIYDPYNNDECVIRFLANKKDTFNSDEEVIKLMNKNINIYSIPAPGQKISVNYLNSFDQLKTYKIKLGISTVKGSYKLQFDEIESFENAIIYLKDHFLNTTTKLNKLGYYSFDVNEDSLSQGENRFELLFNEKTLNIKEDLSNKSNIGAVYPNPFEEQFHIELYPDFNNVAYQLTDYVGKEICNGKIVQQKVFVNTHDLGSGIYILKLYDTLGNVQICKLIKL